MSERPGLGEWLLVAVVVVGVAFFFWSGVIYWLVRL